MHTLITLASYEFLKREANKKKKSSDLSLKEALNEIAVHFKFKDWFHLKSHAKNLDAEVLYMIERDKFLRFSSERLQTSGEWKPAEKDLKLKIDDYVTSSAAEAKLIFKELKSKNPKVFSFGLGGDDDDRFSYDYKILRRKLPSAPTMKNLKEVISNGNDSVMNVLILNVWGKFELRPWNGSGPLDTDPTIVCRHETYVQNGGYVGLKASQDNNFMMQEFVSSLESWVQHLDSGIVGAFLDLPAKHDLEELEKMLKEKEKNWNPDFELVTDKD